uniref:Uncharacterized protein n=1 Tax=Arundo donax TaxID=35708 RepID=A0A0A8YR40_ARUDO
MIKSISIHIHLILLSSQENYCYVPALKRKVAWISICLRRHGDNLR